MQDKRTDQPDGDTGSQKRHASHIIDLRGRQCENVAAALLQAEMAWMTGASSMGFGMLVTTDEEEASRSGSACVGLLTHDQYGRFHAEMETLMGTGKHPWTESRNDD